MHIEHLSLTNFRSYARLELAFPGQIILLQGDNAQGKTNLLEAIYYLATTRSPIARSDHRLINWLVEEREPLPFARIDALVQRLSGSLRVEVTLVKPSGSPYPAAHLRQDEEEEDAESVRAPLRKKIRVNGVVKRALDLVGLVNVVLFIPEDIGLVAGSPKGRRTYLDITLCQVNRDYCRTLNQYNHILLQRNALLRELRERGGDPSQLLFWDEALAGQGAFLIAQRQAALAEMDILALERHRELTGEQEHLRLRYAPSLAVASSPAGYQLSLGLGQSGGPAVPDRLSDYVATIAGHFRERLQQARREELVRGMTTIGPHRDDFRFLVDQVDLTLYGSRGQQRTAALALKLAEMGFMTRVVGERPILLLDDVMSELDAARREHLTRMMNDWAGQVILTTSDWEDYAPDFRARVKLLRVRQGVIEEM
jgi:DNA replication and repair protein RecF